MSTLKETSNPAPLEERQRPSRATVAGTIALVIWPLFGAAAGIAEHFAVPDIDASTNSAGFLDSVSANAGLWNTYCVLMLGMALLTFAWAPAVWRLAVDRSPRWAWTAAVAGTLFALGQTVHLMSWGVLSAALAATATPSAADSFTAAVDSQWFFGLIFAPFLLGSIAAAPIAAVALRRARLLRTWSILVVVAASIAGVVLGTDNLIGLGVYSVLVVAGFAPALVRVLRGRTA